MTKTIPVQRTDAIDQVMPLEGGRTAPFVLPKLRSGIFLAVYDTPARAVRYAADCSPDWPGDFVIHREGGPGSRTVRIVATAGGALANTASVYVTTAGNTWTDSGTQEVYEEVSGDA